MRAINQFVINILIVVVQVSFVFFFQRHQHLDFYLSGSNQERNHTVIRRESLIKDIKRINKYVLFLGALDPFHTTFWPLFFD